MQKLPFSGHSSFLPNRCHIFCRIEKVTGGLTSARRLHRLRRGRRLRGTRRDPRFRDVDGSDVIATTHRASGCTPLAHRYARLQSYRQ